METPKNVVLVVKRYAVLEVQKWWYAVRKGKKRRYALRNGGEGITLIQMRKLDISLHVLRLDQINYVQRFV